MGEFKLFQEICDRSESDDWDEAKLEWDLKDVYFAEEPETCLCGHYPIIELCILRNKYNTTIATVGNCCVKKFLNLPSDSIFTAVKRIRSDIERSLNEDAIDHAISKGWINQWEYDFYINIFRKRKFSDKQSDIKTKINQKVLARMKKSD